MLSHANFRLFLLLLWLGLAQAGLYPAPAAALEGTVVDPAVRQALATQPEVRVNVLLRQTETALQQDGFHDAGEKEKVARLQDGVLQQLPEHAFRLVRRYQTLPALTGMLRAEGVKFLEDEPLVESVRLDAAGEGHLGQSVSALEADRVWTELGYRGQGVTVAVLDTGIDSDHPDLRDAIVAQHCFTDGDCAPHNSNEGNSAEDENGHGTNVSGVIASRGAASSRGFAPAADLVAIRVLDSSNWGWLSDWVAGLDWILANQDTLQVDVINMSLGTVALYDGNCDDTWSIMADVMTRLNDRGIPVFASSGNQGATAAMGSPACNSRVIAVGATYDGSIGRQPISGTYRSRFGGTWPDCYDEVTDLTVITCFTNSGPMLDVVAPGARITAPGRGGGLSTYVGTSQASPSAAGIAALMLEADDTLTPQDIEAVLKESGFPLTDRKNGRRIPMLNAYAAVTAVLPNAPHSVTLEAPTFGVMNVAYGFAATVQPSTVRSPLTYVWEATGQEEQVRHEKGATDSIFFVWPGLGAQTVTVRVENELGQVSDTALLNIIPGFTVHLPQSTR